MFLKVWKNENGKIYEGKNTGVKTSHSVDIDEIYSFGKYIKNEVSKNHVLGFNFKMPEMKYDVPDSPLLVAIPSSL